MSSKPLGSRIAEQLSPERIEEMRREAREEAITSRMKADLQRRPTYSTSPEFLLAGGTPEELESLRAIAEDAAHGMLEARRRNGYNKLPDGEIQAITAELGFIMTRVAGTTALRYAERARALMQTLGDTSGPSRTP